MVRRIRVELRRQRGREPVHVHLVRVQPLRLQEDLVPAASRELDDLVLDGRTVPRAAAADGAAIQRRLLQVTDDDVPELIA